MGKLGVQEQVPAIWTDAGFLTHYMTNIQYYGQGFCVKGLLIPGDRVISVILDVG